MKSTELFRKKMEFILSNTDRYEIELLSRKVYFNKKDKNGITIKKLKKVIPVMEEYGCRIIGIEHYDGKGELHSYCWEHFCEQYEREWIYEAIEQIVKECQNPKCFVYIDCKIV